MTKSVILFLSVIVFFLFVGCASQHYYQLVETETGSMVNEGDFICFENSDIKISYNFWGNQGNGSFIVYNKTDVDLFIDLKAFTFNN
jgi:signal peptidase I